MTVWLERKEKVLRHDRYIKWLKDSQPSLKLANVLHKHQASHFLMTREPSVKAVSLDRLEQMYGAKYIMRAIAKYIVRLNYPDASSAEVVRLATTLRLPFHKLPVYHKAKFWESDFLLYRQASDEYDAIYATPGGRLNKRGQQVAGRFDTAIVNLGTGSAIGVEGYQVCRVWAIFTIPIRYRRILLPFVDPPEYLAYVEWFSNFTQPDPQHGMYKVTPMTNADGTQTGAVIAVESIRRSVHLYPCFRTVAPLPSPTDIFMEQ
ncbi:uncharacterized protein PHACADRAFT_203394 [Phanerochaete carnosa HHB-10118-sp]|uniref:DUF6830 domain-containing protein n=1 Tax=Phanerochaete carnosa (strain HHB-10118-sp) TaxID=650164 RepID=K5UEW6_PHACS|nr:uncharacterized protein PHACADRAFT_203394 [Phanerochaete carnosa HHB-10118-sp]EKM47996.1 hypothetical protein PHACADRAFT_203394 [Phanerochaete carnosa HHB-10118-sp]